MDNQIDILDNSNIPEESRIKDDQKSNFVKFVFSLLRVFIAVVVFGSLLFFVRTPFMFEAPGSCEDTSKFVKVEGAKIFNNHGKFFLTTVIYERANLLFYLWGKIDSSTQLIPIDDPDEKANGSFYNDFMSKQMEMSKLKARIAAFRSLGYDVPLVKTPVTVMSVLPWSRAASVLKKGDSIISINGKSMTKEEILIKAVEDTPPDQNVNMLIKRDNKRIDLEVPLTNKNGKSKIGVLIMSYIKDAKLPMKVSIDSKNISGASAGLMFALEIMRQASGIDLTGGNLIAGTGAIDENGIVYPIEGVRFKVYAAERVGAKYFICPFKNYSEAKAAAKTLKVYPANSLQDALDILKQLNPSATIDGYIRLKK